MEFKIPLKREDLLTRNLPGQYTVQEVLTTREIERKYDECKSALREQGTLFIKDYFDVFYSCLSEHRYLNRKLKTSLWDLLIDAFKRLLSDLNLNLDDVESLDEDLRSRLLNMLKMYIYILCKWLPLFEEDANQNPAIISGKKGKSKQQSAVLDAGFDWVKEKLTFIQLIDRLCKIPYHKLWEQNAVEDEFLNMLINICYKLLESTNMNRLREMKEIIFHILGGLLQNQKHSVGHAMKIIQHLQLFEHLAATLAQAVVILVSNYKMNQLLNEIIREIAAINSQDAAHDNAGNRAFSIFLAEVAKQIPSVVLPNISYLATHLEGDSYNMRNCVLVIMGEILLQTPVDSANELDDRTKMLRDQFLDHLEDHIHDVHAFVRSRCLQIWAQLSENRAIPITRQQRLMDLVIGRLEDKTCSVRKAAIHLLTVILQSNPFASKISLTELEESFVKERTKLSQLTELNKPKENENQDIEMANEAESNPPEKQESENVAKQRVLLLYLKDCIAFAKAVRKALPLVCLLLSSNQITDVMEAISFFVTAYKFGVHNSIIGIQRMLTLVWSKDLELKNAVMDAYKRLYLNPEANTGNRAIAEIVSNLLRLTQNATVGEMTSLERLIHDMVESGDIDKPVINALWDRFRHQDKFSEFESHSAIVLIGMAASADDKIIERNLDVIVEVGLGPRAMTDFLYAKDVCGALLKLSPVKASPENTDNPFCLSSNHQIFKRLALIIKKGISNSNESSWWSLAQRAVDVIYKLSDMPDILCEDIMKAVVPIISTTNETEQSSVTIRSKLLINILLLGSHIALRQMLHYEITIFNELKRRRNIEEEKPVTPSVMKNKRRSINARDFLKESMAESVDAGLNSAVAEDADAEFIRKICDRDLLNGTCAGDRILSSLAQITVDVLSSPTKYSDENLQTAATLALTKFMMVSELFCEAQIQLLFTILEKSKSCATRATITIALGDLFCRFPNTFEPWTQHLFKRVRDEEYEVRQNALAILGHLLLNDMIRVKGCVSDIALCLVDDDIKIEKLAKQLFYDLSLKSNAIFNLMPDIISRLLDAEIVTTEEKFQIIMKYLLNFVKKDRLLESLVEKLCQRFAVMTLGWQWRNLAYCLTLICETEKCCRKLLENVSCFQDQLVDETVFRSFTEIITNARKALKQDQQVLIDELEQQIEYKRKKALGEEVAGRNAVKMLENRTAQRKGRRVANPRSQARTVETPHSIQSPREFKERRPPRSQRKAPILEFSSDDDSDL